MPEFTVICDGSNRDEWLAARNIGVGASEVPILFGCGYGDSSVIDLYLRKTSTDAAPIEENEGMGWGNRLQDAILNELAERADLGPRGDEWCGNKALIHNVLYPQLVCTPDGITSSDEPIEAKNVCMRIDEGDWDGRIPERFNLQCQSQIAVCGSDRCLFGALLFGGRLVWDWIPRNDELIAEIDERTREFWWHVANGVPPKPDGSKASRDAARAIAMRSDPVEVFESELDDILDQWKALKVEESRAKESAESAEKQRRALEDQIILKMGSANEAFTKTGWAFRKRVTNRAGYTVEPKTIETFDVRQPKKKESK